jgi:hypothetical protein
MCFPEYRATNKLEVNTIAQMVVMSEERMRQLQERSKKAEEAIPQLSGQVEAS